MTTDEKRRIYNELLPEIESTLAECPDLISGMATVACILHHAFRQFFWTGFYRVVEPGLLAAGPYQGTLACLTITFERGVCGFCATTGETIIVDDVSKFEGYIACDSRTSSEIVVPVKGKTGELLGVLDIDSTELMAFDIIDAEFLEKVCRTLGECA